MSLTAERPLLRTTVEVGCPPRPVGVGDRSVFLGSCFAEHVGQHFAEARLHAVVNPLGVMYNPMSLARALTTTTTLSERDFAQGKGLWHSWLADSSLSRLTREECQRATADALHQLHEALHEADHLFLTLGTSHYYSVAGEAETLPVANCHKMPGSTFREHEAGMEQMAEALEDALAALHRRNPRLQVVMTVSPYRYQKYGFHESQLSKARLLLCADALVRHHADWVCYFPAYELILDELRDYRFYADDMLHPSPLAVRYVWQRLCESWMDDEAQRYLRRWAPIAQALNHRPLHPEAPEYARFRAQTQEQLAQLQHDYPMLNIE